jgi:hypothetical protein
MGLVVLCARCRRPEIGSGAQGRGLVDRRGGRGEDGISPVFYARYHGYRKFFPLWTPAHGATSLRAGRKPEPASGKLHG